MNKNITKLRKQGRKRRRRTLPLSKAALIFNFHKRDLENKIPDPQKRQEYLTNIIERFDIDIQNDMDEMFPNDLEAKKRYIKQIEAGIGV